MSISHIIDIQLISNRDHVSVGKKQPKWHVSKLQGMMGQKHKAVGKSSVRDLNHDIRYTSMNQCLMYIYTCELYNRHDLDIYVSTPREFSITQNASGIFKNYTLFKSNKS